MAEFSVVIYYQFKGLGGIETLFLRLGEFLRERNIKVTYVLSENSYLFDCLKHSDFRIITLDFGGRFRRSLGTRFYSRRDIAKLRNLGEFFRKEDEKKIVLTGNPAGLAESAIAFLGLKNLYLATGLFHPDTFIRYDRATLSLIKNITGTWLESKCVSRKHMVMTRKLLRVLDITRSLWIMNENTKKYNERYFDLDLSNSMVIPLPIKLEVPKAKIDDESSLLRFCWLGRFTYFKLNELLAVYRAINSFSEKSYSKVCFDIIGSGDRRTVRTIKKVIRSTESVEVNFLGFIPHNKLDNTLLACNVGFGMGTSALEFASRGIATILVPGGHHSVSEVRGKILSDLVYDYGGYRYLQELGIDVQTDSMEPLDDLINKITVSNRTIWIYGNECQKFVLDKFSFEKLGPMLIDFFEETLLRPEDIIGIEGFV